MLSYWEDSVFFNEKDLIIIGGGIVGLNSALELKKALPKLDILVIERDALGAGASTKNAGFACFGSLSEIISDFKKLPEEEVYELIERRKKGIEIIEKNYGHLIEYKNVGGFELFRPEDASVYEKCLDHIPVLNQHFGLKVYEEHPNNFGFNNVAHIIKNNLEGHINTGKYMQILIEACGKAGIPILRGYEVENLSSDGTTATLELNNNITLKAKEVLVCTNGLTQKLLPEIAVEPARAQVIVTSPIENLPFRGTFHYHEGFYYFRDLSDGRVLLGGARETALEEERTMDMKTTPNIMGHLENLLNKVILPHQSYEITHRWAGIMGVGTTKKIIEENVAPNIYVSVRLGGMGVALGGEVAERNKLYYLNKFS